MKHPKSYDSTPETRKRMGKVKLKGGKAECTFAKALWHKGYRYHRNDKRLPGSPDIAILKHKIAVFIDGEFWHGKDWLVRKDKLVRNREYWVQKIEENIARDQINDGALMQLGWMPIHFWEKEVLKNLPCCINSIDELVLQLLVEKMPECKDIPDSEI